ncbi:MAG: hypothetical protein Q8L15_04560 [Methylobacter sp.]|nr:hypothetical protein [Methylobacter sp.]
MDSIVKIGTLSFPGDSDKNSSERLFAHQFGDGFIICSDFPEPDASRAISIAVAIMRHMIIKGYATKAAISAGDMLDIKGYYPKSVRDAESGIVYLGMGLMTIISVMGTALTKAHKLSDTQKGAVLILDDNLAKLGLPEGVELNGDAGNCINWVSSNLPLSDHIAKKSGLETANPQMLIEKLNLYCEQEPTPPAFWIEATRSMIYL